MRGFFDQWMWLHMAVGACAHWVGVKEGVYVSMHVVYELLSNTETGMEVLREIPFWPPKEEKDEVLNMVGDPFWGWIGWRLAAKL